jgi:MoxR-like ATPase
MRFSGTKSYIATEDLTVAVNVAIVLQRPLLIKGEPGTGKTVLAEEIAAALEAPLITWHVKSTTKAQQGLYEYDAVSRLRDSQLGDARVSDISHYIKRGKLWEAFTAPKRPVLLIDEIDKADIEFPNDLLLELDRMEFHVYETGETIRAQARPVIIITSNNEKELPDAFLRRCFFHYIRFPNTETMAAIVEVHFPGIKRRLVEEALRIFFGLREVQGLKKRPSTSELLDWLKLLLSEESGPELLRETNSKKLIPPLAGALLKNEGDVHLLERLAFLTRREGRKNADADPAAPRQGRSARRRRFRARIDGQRPQGRRAHRRLPSRESSRAGPRPCLVRRADTPDIRGSRRRIPPDPRPLRRGSLQCRSRPVARAAPARRQRSQNPARHRP